MPDYVKRATFHEGQVLKPGDLNLAVSYDRNGFARHQRYQHLWGIVTGLELEGDDRTTDQGDSFVEVTVDAGVAVDGTGRTVVVTEPIPLSEVLFDELNVASGAEEDAWFPVFLLGRDVEVRGAAGITSGCETGEPTQIAEAYEITFGRKGDELDLDEQQTVDVTDGPGGGTAAEAWRILLGFVQWDSSINHFTNVEHEAEGVGRRYAGVRAGEVIGAGDELVLRSAERGDGGKPIVVLDGGDKPRMQFGPQNSSGKVSAVMTVDTDGNLTVTGKIVGALAGGIQVESGMATDGMLLPLPPGITQDQVDDGEVVIQTHVTPRFQIPAGTLAAQKWFPHIYECRADGRRVHCRARFIGADGAGVPVDLPWVCDYVMMAFPASEEQGGS